MHFPFVSETASFKLFFSNVLLPHQIKNNVQKIFSKFVGDGKATVKFKEPAHDLVISKVSVSVCSCYAVTVTHLYHAARKYC